MSRGQKWAQLEKEYLPFDWTSDNKFWMKGGSVGDLSVRKGILKYSIFLLKPPQISFFNLCLT